MGRGSRNWRRNAAETKRPRWHPGPEHGGTELDHLSHSQYRAWAECPAAAYAQYVAGTYKPGATEAMALGTLTELAMTAAGDAAELIAMLGERERGLLLTQKGAPTTDARRAVEWGRQTAQLLDLDGCALQAELTAQVGGVPWRCRLDVWDWVHGYIWDIKTCPSDPLAEEWVPRFECRGNFIASRGYGYQLALYREAVRQEVDEIHEVGIVAIGKHKTRDGEAIANVWCFLWQNTEQLDAYLETMAASCLYPWSSAVGKVPPIPEMYAGTGAGLPRCETCDWCVTSRVERVRPYSDPVRRTRT